MQALFSLDQKWCYRIYPKVGGALLKVLVNKDSGSEEPPICIKISWPGLYVFLVKSSSLFSRISKVLVVTTSVLLLNRLKAEAIMDQQFSVC